MKTRDELKKFPDFFYRWKDSVYNDGELFRDATVAVQCDEFRVMRYTPCGAWIMTDKGEKFVNTNANKQWAYANKQDALDSFRRRKNRQIGFKMAELSRAVAALGLASKGTLPDWKDRMPICSIFQNVHKAIEQSKQDTEDQ